MKNELLFIIPNIEGRGRSPLCDPPGFWIYLNKILPVKAWERLSTIGAQLRLLIVAIQSPPPWDGATRYCPLLNYHLCCLRTWKKKMFESISKKCLTLNKRTLSININISNSCVQYPQAESTKIHSYKGTRRNFMHISVLKHPMANTKCLFNFLLTLTIFYANWLFLAAKGVLLSLGKDSFITQNRNEYDGRAS